MRVTAFVGSGRMGHTQRATERFLRSLKSYGDVESEIVRLSDYNLGVCSGCKLCCDRGEELCPLKDDRDVLIRKILDSDGVVFASPVYSYQVSGLMKVFLDRLAYLLHRPRLFGKTSTCIAVEAIYGGRDAVKYLDFLGFMLGFNTVKGRVIKTLEPISEKRQKANEKAIDELAERFHAQLLKKGLPTPSLMKLIMFRGARTSMHRMLTEDYRDYTYYKENGWFDSDYFYPVKLNPLQKLTGRLADKISAQMTKTNKHQHSQAIEGT